MFTINICLWRYPRKLASPKEKGYFKRNVVFQSLFFTGHGEYSVVMWSFKLKIYDLLTTGICCWDTLSWLLTFMKHKHFFWTNGFWEGNQSVPHVRSRRLIWAFWWVKVNVLRPGITMAGGVEVESVESIWLRKDEICLRELDDKKKYVATRQNVFTVFAKFCFSEIYCVFLIHLYFSSL